MRNAVVPGNKCLYSKLATGTARCCPETEGENTKLELRKVRGLLCEASSTYQQYLSFLGFTNQPLSSLVINKSTDSIATYKQKANNYVREFFFTKL